MAYYIAASNIDSEHPDVGWYYIDTDEQGDETINGPFLSKHIALDHMSDGAYTEWLQDLCQDERHEQQFGILEKIPDLD
jgi:hypothetical protein